MTRAFILIRNDEGFFILIRNDEGFHSDTE